MLLEASGLGGAQRQLMRGPRFTPVRTCVRFFEYVLIETFNVDVLLCTGCSSFTSTGLSYLWLRWPTATPRAIAAPLGNPISCIFLGL